MANTRIRKGQLDATLVTTADKLSALAATTSAELITVISDETGSGALVFATSPTLVTPALGTPSALVGTNITGTASGLTAGTATTNANLTGVITSVGNATSIASQTGTGTKFVVDTSPTLVTPILGVAAATTINKVTITAPATNATLTLAQGSSLITAGAFALTLTSGQSTNVTIPTVASLTMARIDAAQTFTGIQTMTSPAQTTSVTTGSTSFTAWAGATTLLTLGGTGASASVFLPSTLDATSSTTGASRTSGGMSAAKALWVGTTANIAGASTLTGVVTTGSTIELGHASDTTLARSSAGIMTIEGIRVRTTTPLIVSAASYTTDTGTSLNMDNLDIFVVTAQAGALLFNSPGGTLVQGRHLIIRIKDNASARALTWNAVFRAMGTALPSTTVVSKTLYLGFYYNSTDTKWDLVASAQEV